MRSVRLGEVVDLNPPTPPVLRKQPEALVSFVPMSGLSEQGLLSPAATRRAADVFSGYSYFECGDVVLAKITPCLENGKAALVSDLPHGIAFGSTEFHVLRPRREITGPYLFYSIWNEAFRRSAAASMTGSAGQKRVPAEFMRRYRIPLPPLPEQHRIAALLDRANTLLRKRREASSLARRLVDSAFVELFGDLAENPKRWPTTTIGDLAPTPGWIVDGPFGSSMKPECYADTGVPVVRNLNIRHDEFDGSSFKFVTKEKYEEVRRSAVVADDILISTKGTIGRVCLMPDLGQPAVLSATGTVRIRLPEASAVRPAFLVRQMLLPGFQRQIRSIEAGSNQKYLNLSGIRRLRVLVPPGSLQDDFLMLRVATIELRRHLRSAEGELATLFDSLLHRVFRGEI